jgi:hypothetical protein
VKLWHYACEHSVAAIIADRGTLRPNPKPGPQELVPGAFVYPVIWLTDVDVRSEADAELVGLAGHFTRCERTGWRFEVPRLASIVPWSVWADAHADPEHRAVLELDRPAERWWVSAAPIAGCRLDERYRRW